MLYNTTNSRMAVQAVPDMDDQVGNRKSFGISCPIRDSV